MARTYKRDANGRFAGGGGGSGRPKAKPVSRGANRLTRDNAGRITSVGGDGATARGGRLRTASGRRRAAVTAKATGRMSGTVKKGANKLPKGQRNEGTAIPRPTTGGTASRPGSMTATLRGTMRALAQADARFIREIEGITGQPLRAPRGGGGSAAAGRVRATARGGRVSDTLRAGLRELAQSDARMARGMAEIVRDATPKLSGSGRSGGRRIGAGRRRLPGS